MPEIVRTFHDLENQLPLRDQTLVHPPSRQILRREEEAVRSPQAPALQRPDEGRPRSVSMMLDNYRALRREGVPQRSQLQRIEQAIQMNGGLNRPWSVT